MISCLDCQWNEVCICANCDCYSICEEDCEGSPREICVEDL